jgi:hypothetical protein
LNLDWDAILQICRADGAGLAAGNGGAVPDLDCSRQKRGPEIRLKAWKKYHRTFQWKDKDRPHHAYATRTAKGFHREVWQDGTNY